MQEINEPQDSTLENPQEIVCSGGVKIKLGQIFDNREVNRDGE